MTFGPSRQGEMMKPLEWTKVLDHIAHTPLGEVRVTRLKIAKVLWSLSLPGHNLPLHFPTVKAAKKFAEEWWQTVSTKPTEPQ